MRARRKERLVRTVPDAIISRLRLGARPSYRVVVGARDRGAVRASPGACKSMQALGMVEDGDRGTVRAGQ
jgi:hypothetical protein